MNDGTWAFFFHIYRKLVVLHEVGMRLEIIPLKV